jgi:hypothetical protein
MSVNTSARINVLADHYRCSESFQASMAVSGLPPESGYAAPFDPNEIIYNLRHERYIAPSRGLLSRAVKQMYYSLRPFMPVRARKKLQRFYLRSWRDISFPSWPVDRTVENIFEEAIKTALESQRVSRMPFVWFWPSGYSGCVILTHDVETETGRQRCHPLIDVDAQFGMRSAFQIVPEERYEVTDSFLDSLRSRGSEINLHGLNHDGRLFADRKTFLQQAERINRYAAQYRANGFRSPVLYRNLDWFADLNFSYDMSVPNVAHLDPQRGGCCTVMPYFIGRMVELPLTTTQDFSLFHMLGHNSIELWRQQIDLVLEKHGLISFNVHPDYIMEEPYLSHYHRLLEHLAKICADRNIWIALPNEVDRWWRERRELSAKDGVNIAYAHLDHGRVVYELPSLFKLADSKLAIREVVH